MNLAEAVYMYIFNAIQIYLLYLIVLRLTPVRRTPLWKLMLLLFSNPIAIQLFTLLFDSRAVSTIAGLAFLLLTVLLLYGWKLTNIAAFLLFMIFTILSEGLAALIVSIPSPNIRSLITTSTVYGYAAIALSRVVESLVTFTFLRVFRKDKARPEYRMSGFVFTGLVIVSLMLLCVMLVYMLAANSEPIPDWFLVIFMVFTVLFITIALITQMIAMQAIQEKDERKLIDLQGEMSMEVHRSLEQLKQYEHDYRKHLQTILSLTHRGMNAEAEKYYNELTAELDRSNLCLIENLPALSATLQRFKSLSQKKEIAFSAELPQTLCTNASEMHLCVVMSNLLDNAVEACEKVSESRGISVSLSGNTETKMVAIYVKNTFDKTKNTLHFNNGLPDTTKENCDLHGYGLRSVKRIVQIYKGSLDIQYGDDGIFEVRITI